MHRTVLKEEIMKRRIIISLILLVLVFSTSAQAQDQDGGSFLKKMEQMLSQMTDEQKAFARANWLEPPVPYTRKHDHPFAYMVLPNPAPDTQTGVECSGCSSAYLLRFYGEKVNGVALYHQSTFPSKHEGGAYPKCFKILFEQQYKNYTTEYYTGTTEDLKDAISQGIPVIVLLFTGQSLHYVPQWRDTEMCLAILHTTRPLTSSSSMPCGTSPSSRVNASLWSFIRTIKVYSFYSAFFDMRQKCGHFWAKNA